MNLYLYLLDTLADWEIAFLTAEVHSRRFFPKDAPACRIVKVGNDRKPITTLGGLTIVPDITIDEMLDGPSDILVLPGGDLWMSSATDRILAVARQRVEKDRLVAAICGATLGLGRVSALNEKKHTSNDLGYLKHVAKEYRGEKNYQTLPAVNDRNLITASGQSALEFTVEVLLALKLMKPDALSAWLNLHKTNAPKYFFELMKSIQPA